jgi:hypothetical protein
LSDVESDLPSRKTTSLQDLRIRRDSPIADSRDAFVELKKQLRDEIVAQAAQADPKIDLSDRSQVRPFTHDCLNDLLEKRGIVLNKNEKRQLLDELVADLMASRT